MIITAINIWWKIQWWPHGLCNYLNWYSLGELMKIEGVYAAGEFTPDGKLIGHRENMNMPKQMA